MYVYCMCAWCLQRPGGGVGSFGSGVNRWPLANMGVLGIELGLPQEQPVLITAELAWKGREVGKWPGLSQHSTVPR